MSTPIETQEAMEEFLKIHNIPFSLALHSPAPTSEEHGEFLKDFLDKKCGGFTHEGARISLIKNMFLKDKRRGDLFLISYDVNTKVEMKMLSKIEGFKASGGNVRFADEDVLYKHLNVRKGSVTPLALVNNTEKNVKFIIDKNALESDFLLVHPMQNHATLCIKKDDFVRFLKEICRIDFQVADFNSL